MVQNTDAQGIPPPYREGTASADGKVRGGRGGGGFGVASNAVGGPQQGLKGSLKDPALQP